MHVNSTSTNPLQNLLSADPSAPANQKKMQLLRQQLQNDPAPPPVLGAPQGGGTTTGLTFGAIDPEAARGGIPLGSQPDPESTAPGTPLTVDGLLQAWGRADPMYDLDQNGTVNMQDLVALLAQLSQPDQGANPPGQPPGETGQTGAFETEVVPSSPGDNVAPELTVDGLMKAWGEKGSEYDLDGNGTVGMSDLVELLSRLAAGNGDDGQSGGTGALDALQNAARTTNVFEGEGGAIGNGLTVEGLLEQWGARGGDYDLDGDGTVGMQDLVALLSRLNDNANETGGAVAPPGPRGGFGPNGDMSRVDFYAKRLVQNFQDHGFTNNPPENLHQIVDALNLPNDETRAIFNSIQEAYPRGLGLSVLG